MEANGRPHVGMQPKPNEPRKVVGVSDHRALIAPPPPKVVSNAPNVVKAAGVDAPNGMPVATPRRMRHLRRPIPRSTPLQPLSLELARLRPEESGVKVAVVGVAKVARRTVGP